MSKTFVAINDSVHRLLRELTRRTPLEPGSIDGGLPLLEYRVREEELPDAYYSLAMLHAVGGMSLEALPAARWRIKAADRAPVSAQVNYFDVLKLDKRCARDLRFRFKKQGPSMLAAELLAYGLGTLRARNDDPDAPLHQYLWSQHGRLQTAHEEVYANLRTLHSHAAPPQDEVGKESFDSTNLIYGDAYGELEQVWARRDDTSFLELLVQNLQRLRRQREIAVGLQPPLHLEALMQLHLQRQAVWITPPPGVRALLRRLEFIFERTTVDDEARTVFSLAEAARRPEPEPQPQAPRASELSWNGDRSGYDGWLACP